MKILRVALNVPLPTLFDYACDGAMPAAGTRVRVPFGRKQMLGIVMAAGGDSALDPARIRNIEAVLDDFPPLPAELLELAGFLGEYYQHPVGEALFSALPLPLRSAKPFRLPSRAVYSINAGAAAALRKGAKNQQRLLALLRQRRCISHLELAAAAPALVPAAKALVEAGVLRSDELAAAPGHAFVDRNVLNAEQAAAVEEIRAHGRRFGVFVLHGITGSGKTEVYMRAIAGQLRERRQCLVLVPEISLTPQLEQSFRSRFPDAAIVSLHSALSDTERTTHWLAAQAGDAQIVLGTRLAALTPVPRLGLVIVDEEHDASFKQQEGMRYSARDVAIWRAKKRGVPIVLGSATPSLETYAHAMSGRYRLLRLAERAVESAVLPPVRTVDTRGAKLQQGLSATLVEAVRFRLERGEQSLVFINRRGYAPVLGCPACGWVCGCTRCSSNLVLHLAERVLRCHHCGLQARIPRLCQTCGNQDIHPFGRGTQRIEETLQQAFPRARVVRVDRDSTRTKRAWETLLERIHRGDADILVGTQMLAKGHDFPKMTLVGILNSDSALFAADYRAPERLFATLLQVAGRAGRADLPGEVLIQTEHPDHPLYRALAHHDFAEFARSQLAEREAAGFPPYVYQAMLRADAPRLEQAVAFLDAARHLPPAAVAAARKVKVYDPVPMTLARLASRERAQLLAESPSRPALQRFLAEWVPMLYGMHARNLRWSIDVDPIEF